MTLINKTEFSDKYQLTGPFSSQHNWSENTNSSWIRTWNWDCLIPLAEWNFPELNYSVQFEGCTKAEGTVSLVVQSDDCHWIKRLWKKAGMGCFNVLSHKGLKRLRKL